MPIITPPSVDDDDLKPLPEVRSDSPISDYNRVQIYMNVKPWKCRECTTVMFGRCVKCVYCWFKLGKLTPRPADWTDEWYDGPNPFLKR